MATTSLFSLARIARDLSARTVLPHVVNSHLVGIPTGNIQLDMLYDMTAVNSELLCGKYKIPDLVSFDHFIQFADRRITYIHLVWDNQPSSDKFTNSAIIDCSDWAAVKNIGVDMLGQLNAIASGLELAPFEIDGFYCINPKMPITPQDIYNKCGLKENLNLTVVFDQWRGHFRSHFSTISKAEIPFPNRDVYPVSKGVEDNATAFLNTFAANESFMAVHFRTGVMPGRDVEACLEDKLQQFRNISLNKYNNISIFYFVDYGSYGIPKWQQHEATEKLDHLLKKHRIVPKQYEPKLFNGIPTSGFVSLVEQCAIAQAKVLVLVGGGSFHSELVQKYKKKYNGTDTNYIYTQC